MHLLCEVCAALACFRELLFDCFDPQDTRGALKNSVHLCVINCTFVLVKPVLFIIVFIFFKKASNYWLLKLALLVQKYNL
jgi:hypothetical protein